MPLAGEIFLKPRRAIGWYQPRAALCLSGIV
jgi:hypothetical protein